MRDVVKNHARIARHQCRAATKPGHRRLGSMIVVIAILHIMGWLTLIGIVAPQHLAVGARTFDIGIGVTAYMLGIRHALDADHIAAIDNTTR